MKKKAVAVKSIRRYTALLTLIVLLIILIVPYVQARYTGKAQFSIAGGTAEYIDTGISGISNEELDLLFEKMMDARYPIGSIYVSVNGVTPDYGVWQAWGEGRVPVGIDANNVLSNGGGVVDPREFDFRTLLSSGSTNTTATGTATVPNNTSLGTLALTNGKVEVSRGAISWPTADRGRINITGPSTVNSENIKLGSSHLPRHTHSYDWGAAEGTHKNGTVGYWGVRPDKGHTGSGQGYFNPSASTGNTGGGAEWRASYTSFPWSSYYATITGSSISINTPINYTQQSFTGPVTIGGESTATIDDYSIQPYTACYIYQRVS